MARPQLALPAVLVPGVLRAPGWGPAPRARAGNLSIIRDVAERAPAHGLLYDGAMRNAVLVALSLSLVGCTVGEGSEGGDDGTGSDGGTGGGGDGISGKITQSTQWSGN